VLGTALIRGGEVDRGQQVIDRILRHGDSAEAHLLLGTARLTARDYPGAAEEFRRAIKAAPDLPTAHSLYGRALLATGGRDQAVAAFRRELELNPIDYDANLYLGVLLRQDRHDAEALGYLQRALEIRPGAPEARYQIGSLYLAIGNAEEARKVLEGLVRDIPGFVEAHVSLATAYYRLKRKEDGDRHRAIAEKLNAEIQARAPGASEELGPAYRGETLPAGPPSTGGADEIAAMEARSAVQAASAPSPSPSPPAVKPRPVAQQMESFEELAQRAHAAREGERFEEAISLYQEALKLRPTWSEGWWYLGTLYYGQDRYDEAVGPLRRLVALEPQGGAGWALLGLSEFQIRDYDRALEHLQRAQALRISSNPQLWQVVRFRLAQLLTRFQQFEAATLHFHALVRDRGENPSLIESMGIATLSLPYLPAELPPDKREMVMLAGRAQYYVAARNMEEARRLFLQLTGQYATTPNVHYAYGVYLLRDAHDEAIEEFKKELEISPAHVSARLQIAFEYLRRAEPQRGLPYAREAARLAPHSFAARNAYGRCLLETGDLEAAIRELEEGVRLAPDSPETRYALARAYARAGRREDAARERAEFAKLDKIRRGLTDDAGGDSEPSPDQRPPI
jgi:tetratricopeptide (TPR) repeat protein